MKPDAIPSLFPWTRTSPRKRKPPKERTVSSTITITTTGSQNVEEEESIVEPGVEQIEEFSEVSETVFFADVATQTDLDASEFEAIVTKDEKIQAIQNKLTELQNKVKDLEDNNEKPKRKVFTLDSFTSSNKAGQFYTHFENWDAFMAIYRYLNPGQNGENIRYWNESYTNFSTADLDQDRGGRPRSLNPLQEYF